MDDNNNKQAPTALQEIAAATGGKITSVSGPLPDGSGFATMSIPLPKDHWIYGEDRNEPPMPFQMGTKDDFMFAAGGGQKHVPIYNREQVAEMIRAAGRYAIRGATMNGKEMDFDPDALLQNLIVGMLGYWTEDGTSEGKL